MNLLLLLTALFASLTGALAGERGVRQVPGVAVVRASESVQAAVQPARCRQPMGAVHWSLPRVAVFPALPQSPLRSLRLAFERRLE